MTQSKQQAVGTFFKPVVIDPRLRDLVNMILLAPSATDPGVLSAKKRLRAMTTPGTSYLFATEIQKYLDAKRSGSTDCRVYPIVGDLFLDALEANYLSLGPNFFRDHYSNLTWSYRQGESPMKTVQGAFYCIELILRKTLDVFMARDTPRKASSVRLSFQTDEDLDYRTTITLFHDLGKQCVQDAIEAATRVDKTISGAPFIDFVVDYKKIMEATLARWDRYHRRRDLPNLSNDAYLDGVANAAEESGHPPLVAAVKELQVQHRELKGQLADSKTELEHGVHPLYDAASMYLSQGNLERDAGVYDMALRRYKRAAALFMKIHDRTSTAKVYVEQARLFIQSGEDPGAIQEGLREAIALIMAHMRNMPKGRVPEVSHESAIEFLRTKGYVVEAEAYAASLTAP
ncbi:MAG: tetratricopeptide repeat protein [Candidatus Hydrogenedentes bacterium]|nr:tetratricopeptide repeat protein [Candidatus Hydrogenedentota bacterium]